MNRKAEAHDLPSCLATTKLWYNHTRHRSSSGCKGKYVPRENQKVGLENLTYAIQIHKWEIYGEVNGSKTGKPPV